MPIAKAQLTRREMLMTSVAGAGLMAIVPFAAFAANDRPALRIPPQDLGELADGKRQFNLKVGFGRTEFFTGFETDTMGINGSYLGPVLRFRKGETVRLKVNNGLNQDTTLHWHGFNLPAASDGGPHQVVTPNDTWTAEFEVREKAATMWYHSHLMGKTADQVWAGLAGMIIIDDDESDDLTLPTTYGVDDIPVVLQDRSFNRYAQMPYNPGMHFRMMGMTGETPLVNGTVAPFLDVTTSLVRLRLLNGSNGSIYMLGFEDGRSFDVIANDGGLLGAPVTTQIIRLAPGERAEIIVDMSDKTPAMLRSFSIQTEAMGNGMGGMMRGMMDEGTPEFEFLELRPAAQLKASADIPAQLTDLPVPDASTASNTRQFELQMQGMMMMNALTGGGFTINGKSMKLSRIDEIVKRDTTEIWQISNTSMMAHPFHIHNTQFRILDRNGGPPHPAEMGRKDTVLVHPGETVNLLIRFEKYTDPDTPYMYHCHILEHEDAGMMGQFVVV